MIIHEGNFEELDIVLLSFSYYLIFRNSGEGSKCHPLLRRRPWSYISLCSTLPVLSWIYKPAITVCASILKPTMTTDMEP